MDSAEERRASDFTLGPDLDNELSGTESNATEDRQDSRTTKFANTSKKRKLSSSPDDSDNDYSDGSSSFRPHDSFSNLNRSQSEDASSTSISLQPSHNPPPRKPLIALTPISKRGVIYISRIPPYLKPHTLRQMISIHGPVTNLFLTPEPPTAYHHRVHTHHGNKKRQYIDGWVEFKHRRHARACVDALNGRTTAEGLGVGAIGGRKGGKGRWYRDDVWSVRYLKGFSWDDLMQSARTEEREREEKIRFGLVREKKERQAFLDGVQHAKVEKTRQAKKQRRRDGERSEKASLTDRHGPEAKGFQQNESKMRQRNPANSDAVVQRVLSKIF